MRTTETDSLQLDSAVIEDALIPRLTVVRHPDPSLVGVGQSLASGKRLTLGRSGTLLAGVFEHGRVSREHAQITLEKGRMRLRDLESRNGTWVNGDAIERPTLLEDDDVIGIGPVLLLAHRGPRHLDEPDDDLLWGVSHAIVHLLAKIERVAEQRDNVVLVGETGVGKELVAKALHAASGASGRLVALNCATITDGVVASELFGHVRGAFSGADAARKGLVESAEDGTLFLDEVAAASPKLQAALLRVLEDQAVRPVGATESRKANVRFVAALQEGGPGEEALRDDLWFRLATQRIRIPPLRERRQDVTYLAQRFAEAKTGEPVRLGRAAALAMLRHDWPGNVRELRAIVDQLLVDHPPKAVDDEVELEAPASAVTALATRASTNPSSSSPDAQAKKPAKRPSRSAIEETLRSEEGRVSDAAKRLGVARKTLYRWLDAYAIDVDRFRGA